MSYEPTNWKDGDLVTSAKLNKLEQGVASCGGGGSLMVHATVSENAVTLDKTWKEIHDAVQEKYVGIIIRDDAGVTNLPIIGVVVFGSTFIISTISAIDELGIITFMTDSEDGYPTYVIGNSNQGGLDISTPVGDGVR